MSRRWGLLGGSLSHSLSPAFFQAKFAAEGLTDTHYDLFERSDAASVRALFAEHPDLEGLNVTVPHKVAVMEHLDALTPAATAIGAVNAVRREADGRLTGHNTDAHGFVASLRPFLTGDHDRAIIVGAGGAAAAVRYGLAGLGIDAVHAVRRDLPACTPFRWVRLDGIEAAAVKHYRLIVQATPVGTAPDTEEAVDFPWEGVGERHFVVDLVYNPPRTRFLRNAEARGALTLNGADMLRLQAEAAWGFWNR
jgi:shikimate dehydrogenase